MSARPRIDPGLAAAVLAAAPTRLRRRLDAEPRLAESWTWGEDGTVTVDAQTRVSFAGDELLREEQLRCTCLLSPRCLHVLACVALLPLAEAAPAPIPPEAVAASDPPAAGLRAAATEALTACGGLLAGGTSGAGAVVQAGLLRALHGARCAGAHRLAGALADVLGEARRLRGGEATASAEAALGAAAATCAAALALLADDAGAADIGVARRAYTPVGSLRLHGLCSEPVLTAGGWAGVVTWLADAQGRLWSLGDVQPGDAPRVVQAWQGGVRLGDLSLSHAELARGGALVQDATASPEGRLGSGAAVQAVRAVGASWHEPPLAALFARPVAEQLAAALADDGPAGLLMLRGDLVAGQLQVTDGPQLELLPPVADGRLPGAANLRALAAAAPGEVLVVVRPLRQQAGCARLLAFAPLGDGGPRLPAAMQGRIMFGLEHLPHAGLGSGGAAPDIPAAGSAAWEPLRRRALAVLLGGRSALPTGLAATVAAETSRLRRRLCRSAADRLDALFAACQAAPGARWGRLSFPSPEALARAWAGAALHASRAERHANGAAWQAWAEGG